MSRHNGIGFALGMGIAGAMVGMCIGSMSKPQYQREIRRGIHKATDELNDMASELGDSFHEMTMHR